MPALPQAVKLGSKGVALFATRGALPLIGGVIGAGASASLLRSAPAAFRANCNFQELRLNLPAPCRAKRDPRLPWLFAAACACPSEAHPLASHEKDRLYCARSCRVYGTGYTRFRFLTLLFALFFAVVDGQSTKAVARAAMQVFFPGGRAARHGAARLAE